MQRASQELSCTTLLSWPFSQSKALRMMVITFQLLNQPYTLSINFPPMFPSPRYHCFCVAAQLVSLIATPFLQASPSQCMLTFHWHCTCKQCCAHRKYACNNWILVALLTYVHTYIHTNAKSACNTISYLASRSAISTFKLIILWVGNSDNYQVLAMARPSWTTQTYVPVTEYILHIIFCQIFRINVKVDDTHSKGKYDHRQDLQVCMTYVYVAAQYYPHSIH